MRIYVTSRFKGSADNKVEIEKLCSAVRNAGMEDFHFIRDVENYQSDFFATQREVWVAAETFSAAVAKVIRTEDIVFADSASTRCGSGMGRQRDD